MPAGSVFPAFVQLRYESDGTAKGRFLSEVDTLLGSAEKRFAEFGKEAGRQLDAALATQRTPTGALDLNVAGQRAAADAARARAVAARELAVATATAARENGDFSQKTRLAVAALQAQAREEDQAAAAALSHARALEQVQGVLNRQASAVTAVTGATRRSIAVNDNFTASAGQQRAAMNQLSFQLGDIAQGFAVGTPPAIIFAQQIGQVTQAVQLMGGGGALGGVARFLGGPWGTVLASAAVVLSPFIGKLFEAKSAAEGVTFTSYSLGEAQGILGSIVDTTSGKIERQSVALIALARAQALAGQIKARADLASARSELGGLAAKRTVIGGNFGGGLTITRGRDATGDIASALLDGSINPAEAVAGLNSLNRAGIATEDAFLKAAQAATKLGVAAENLKAFQSVERLITGQGTAADRALLLKPSKAKAPRSKSDSGAGKAATLEFGEDAAKRIADLADQFGNITPAVAQANKATRQLDDILSDIERRRPPNYDKLIADANTAKGLINDNLAQPFRDILEQQSRGIEVQRLQVAGREAEAEILQLQFTLMDQLGVEEREQVEAALAKLGIGKAQYAQMLANLGVQRNLTREGQRAAAALQKQFAFIADTRSNLVQTVASLRTDGLGAIGGFFKRALDQFNAAAAESLIDSFFGSAFQSAEDQVTQAHRLLAQSSLTAAKALNSLADATAGAAGGTDPATDEITNEIVVLGKKIEDYSNPRDLVRLIARELAKAGGLSDEDAARLGKAIGSAFQGAAIGSVTSGVLKSLGVKSSTTGAQVGGAIGQVAFGPIGGIVGSIAGGLIGGLFKKTRTGSATLGFGADGLGITGTAGNSKSQRDAASSAAGSIGDSLNRIAEQLGGSADGPISVSIGIRNKKYRVDTTGSGKTKGAGVLDFGQDQAAALKAAIADAIRDGVITGISAGAQRLLKGGSDVDKQLAKALSFEGTLARVKALRDPVGAALDTLDKEFTRLRSIFTEAGASAGEYADLERLYGSERAKAVKEATDAIAGSLRSLYADLTIGDDARSLRDRKAAAQAAYDPLAARVAAGDTTAFDQFSEAARALLEIERQFSGSQISYFTLADQVTGLTKSRLDELDAMAAASTGRDSPFSNSGVPVDSSANVVSAVQQQTTDLIDGLLPTLQAVNDNIVAMLIRTGTQAEPQINTGRGFF